jgi:hypothetical protein
MVGAKFRRRTRAFILPQAVLTLQNNPVNTILCKPARGLSIAADAIFPNFVLLDTRV